MKSKIFEIKNAVKTCKSQVDYCIHIMQAILYVGHSHGDEFLPLPVVCDDCGNTTGSLSNWEAESMLKILPSGSFPSILPS